MSIPAYVKYVGLTLLFLLATVNFAKTTINIINSSKRLDETRNKVASLEVEKKDLKSELDYKKSDEFVEKEARNKLGLARPGEQIFVTPKVLGSMAHNEASYVNLKEASNFRLWMNLFF